MDSHYHKIGISDLVKVFPQTGSSIEDSLFVADVEYDRAMKVLWHPCRFDGYLVVCCRKGRFNVNINLGRYEVEEGSLVVCTPGNFFQLDSVEMEDVRESRFVVIAAREDVLSGLNVDLSRLLEESVSLFDNPCISLTPSEIDVFDRYVDISRSILSVDNTGAMDALRSLASSALYLLGGIWGERIEKARALSAGRNLRTKTLFHEFLKLVSEYHCTERNVSFYADKLCLTPKYLSKVIRNASGKSAPQWIDSYVILEAKNMLKYSEMTIKEVVYRLHFPDASSFYKFFKAHTGVIPSEYRKKL